MINCNTCIVGITFLMASIYSIIHGHKKDIFIKFSQLLNDKQQIISIAKEAFRYSRFQIDKRCFI